MTSLEIILDETCRKFRNKAFICQIIITKGAIAFILKSQTITNYKVITLNIDYIQW